MSYYKQTLPFTPISPEQEIELFERWKDKEDFSARDQIVEAHLRYALSEGLKASRGTLPEDDVTSAANLGLMKAVYRFCPVKAKASGARFAAFARKYIRGEVLELFKKIKNNTVSLESLSEAHTERVGWTRQHADIRQSDNTLLCSDESVADTVSNSDFYKFWGERAKQAMAKLPESHRELIQQIAVEGRSLAEVGRAQTPPVTRAAVRLRYQRAIARLKSLLSEYERT